MLGSTSSTLELKSNEQRIWKNRAYAVLIREKNDYQKKGVMRKVINTSGIRLALFP